LNFIQIYLSEKSMRSLAIDRLGQNRFQPTCCMSIR